MNLVNDDKHKDGEFRCSVSKSFFHYNLLNPVRRGSVHVASTLSVKFIVFNVCLDT